MLLGFTEKEIEAKSQDIIEFAEIGDFIDRLVRTYSKHPDFPAVQPQYLITQLFEGRNTVQM